MGHKDVNSKFYLYYYISFAVRLCRAGGSPLKWNCKNEPAARSTSTVSAKLVLSGE